MLKIVKNSIDDEKEARKRGRLKGIEVEEIAKGKSKGKVLGKYEAKSEIEWINFKNIFFFILFIVLIVGLIFAGYKIKGFIKENIKGSFNETCKNNENCISEKCESGLCTCSSAGGVCKEDADCCSTHPYCEKKLTTKYCTAYKPEYSTFGVAMWLIITIFVLVIILKFVSWVNRI